jgi:2'-5' RNA ligase
MRTFVAVELDQTIKETLSLLIQKLETGNRNVRWVKPQGMHLTLKFLGEVPEDKIPEIQSILSDISRNYARFQLTLKGTGFFPPAPKIPRVIWVGIENNEVLQNIQARVENELHKIRFPKEKRKFQAHLTLGRVKIPRNLEPVLEKLDYHKQDEFGTMSVTKLTFFKSVLKPTGAEYTILSESYLQ